jgi:hypothetical protein
MLEISPALQRSCQQKLWQVESDRAKTQARRQGAMELTVIVALGYDALLGSTVKSAYAVAKAPSSKSQKWVRNKHSAPIPACMVYSILNL